MQLYAQILTKIKTFESLQPGAKVVVGVSGGVDSVALLHLLYRLQAELDMELHIVHVNHLLRGEAAKEDAYFVNALADKLKIACHISTIDVAALAQTRKLSIEHVARLARYTALAQTAQAIDAHVIALAHNADDQAETVLLNLLRGAGSAGLRGMQTIAPLSNTHLLKPVDVRLTLFRPLLDVRRSEIEVYCAEHKLEFRMDATNTDLAYRRNRLRHEIIPILETINPDLKTTLSRTAAIISAEHDYLEKQTAAAFQDSLLMQKNTYIELDLSHWQALPLALQRMTIRHAIEVVRGSAHNLTFAHLEQIVVLAANGRTGTQAELPGDLLCQIDYEKIIIKTTGSYNPLPDWPLIDANAGLSMKYSRRYDLPGSNWEIEVIGPQTVRPLSAVLQRNPWAAVLDADQLEFPLTVRTRQPGDRFRPQGAGGSQKISDFMINAKIPAAYRDNIPLLTSGDQIVWVCGWRVAQSYIVTEQTQHILLVRFVALDNE